MKRLSGIDIWIAKNQPYGYWRVGNPILKLIIITMLLYGLINQNQGLMMQTIVLILIVLYLPYSTKSAFFVVLMNFGLGSLLVGLFNPRIIPYDKLSFSFELKNIAIFDSVRLVLVVFLIIIFYLISKAFTSRDYAWLFDIPQKLFRVPIAGYIHAYAYTFLRGYNIIRNVDISIRSRGIPRPIKIFKYNLDDKIKILGIWVKNVLDECDNLENTIKFVIISRYNAYKRETPIWRKWSETDKSIMGVIVLTIIVPRIFKI